MKREDFNPRPRKEGDIISYGSLLYSKPYFNPRPRKEGDSFGSLDIKRLGISIHALVKRATYQLPARLRGAGISIHALVKRATRKV